MSPRNVVAYRGVLLADMTREELLGVVLELSRALDQERERKRAMIHAAAVGEVELARRGAE